MDDVIIDGSDSEQEEFSCTAFINELQSINVGEVKKPKKKCTPKEKEDAYRINNFSVYPKFHVTRSKMPPSQKESISKETLYKPANKKRRSAKMMAGLRRWRRL